MKFVYEYRTRDNVRHEGEIAAADREAAFAALRAQGIKPGRLVEAPGLFNKLFGKGKRWLMIVVLAAGCLVLGALAIRVSRQAQGTARLTLGAQSLVEALDSKTRRQLIGDAAVIEKGIRTGWTDVFESEGERFLASFAVPGTPPAIRATTVEALQSLLTPPPHPAPSTKHQAPRTNHQPPTTIEARQIKAMVEGIKAELRQFVADGGTVVQFGRRLVQRQEMELGYYNRVKNEIDAAVAAGKSDDEVERLWEDRNAKLRGMGIRLVPMPE